MKRIIRTTTSVWTREEGFSVLLVLLVVRLFITPLLKEWLPGLTVVSAGLLIILFVVGAFVISRTVWGAIGASLLAGTAIALEVVRQIDHSDPFALWRLGSAALTVGLFTFVMLVRVFGHGPKTSHRLIGAVVAFLLVGLTWAYLYSLLETARPGSFNAGKESLGGDFPGLLYYSFVTLTTVGYGDITPLSAAARSLSNMESLVGVLYPAVFIGRLLSKDRTPKPPPPPAG